MRKDPVVKELVDFFVSLWTKVKSYVVSIVIGFIVLVFGEWVWCPVYQSISGGEDIRGLICYLIFIVIVCTAILCTKLKNDNIE